MRIFSMSLLIFFTAAFSSFAAESPVVDTGRVNAQLVSSHDVVAPGQEFYVALRTKLDSHWHTYWKNPGDSGEPVQITWMVPDSLTYGDIIWPLPETIATGPIINYGFEGTPYFPVKFKVAENAQPGEFLQINADVYYLVCKDVCIPEDAQLSLDVMVGEPVPHGRWQDMINAALSSAPKLGDIKGGVVKDGDETVFTFTDLPKNADLKDTHFFPFKQGVLDHSAPQTFIQGERGLQMRTAKSYDWDTGQPENASGVLRYKQNGKFVGTDVAIAVGDVLDIGAGVPSVNSAGADGVSPIGFWGAILSAFVGGLILNIMPCVFPVISIKALSIAKMAHGERRAVRREGWIYTAGVMVTFLILAGVIIAVQAAGNAAGWGFQLQSPKIVAALALLLFVVGLNLLGVFEVSGALGGTGSSLSQKSGPAGTFFTGALAVILATPCTAPFMGVAMGYAFVQPPVITVAVFTALALGFAAPFLLLGYFPKLLSALPKPGAWMVRFKEFLAFPMFAVVIYLLWVLAQQAGEKGLGLTLLAMLGFGFAIWLWKSAKIWTRGLALAVLIGAVIIPFTLHAKAVELAPGAQAWSTEKVKSLRAEGQAVFVDFTAAWCVTCKANKITVLDTKDVQAALAETETAFLVADWTNKNDVIAQELARHGRAGVPLYLLYTAGHDDVSPVILPQTLTKTMVIKALKANQ